jgi:hypothetical protein
VDKMMATVECTNKKDGRKEVADKAMRILIASGEYNANVCVSLVILANLGWYCDVANIFIRQRQIQIVP